MASFARAARFMVLLQIALFIVSAVFMSSSVCHGAREIKASVGTGTLDPNRPAVCIGGLCPRPGRSYTRPCRAYNNCPPAGQP
ncbi:translation initiation factor IF-2-like [Hordeum vulgare]|nr:translation initiation factor IF-2-like [Hordeum vulgare]KAI4971746.1 hypothetical protein ZWY2020_002660 [Hordeum vulgare]